MKLSSRDDSSPDCCHLWWISFCGVFCFSVQRTAVTGHQYPVCECSYSSWRPRLGVLFSISQVFTSLLFSLSQLVWNLLLPSKIAMSLHIQNDEVKHQIIWVNVEKDLQMITLFYLCFYKVPPGVLSHKYVRVSNSEALIAIKYIL